MLIHILGAQAPWLPNLRATPHVAGWTEGLLERRDALVAENIRRLARGAPLENVVRPAG